MASSPDEIRLRYLYRRLVLGGSVRLPLDAARRLVGPDCAYHLYATGQAPRQEPAPEPPAGRETTGD
jgi:hypothetical protein